MRLILAIWAGKIISYFTSLFGLGKASAAPGLVGLKIYPNLIRDLAKEIKQKRIVISATNGKTTTSAMIRAVLDEVSASYISNETGSNLLRGIASSMIASCDWNAKFDADYGIFEVDEAVLPYAIKEIKPDIIILGNIFRDQLDRYGEIDTILAKWKSALQNASNDVKIILNADDPGIAVLRNGLRQETIFYGIKAQQADNKVLLEHAADTINCPDCHEELKYKNRQFSHLGDYFCPHCGFKRPKIDILAEDIKIKANKISFQWFDKQVMINIAGVYNVYNALAAISAGRVLDIANDSIINALKNVKPAFGRMEEFKLNDQQFKIILIKNPTGANTVLEAIKQAKNKILLIALNDNIADGTDVSWIYDVDFEKLEDVAQIICLGVRKYDLAIRLKYAGIEKRKITIGSDYIQEIEKLSKNNQDIIYILPTYTAMLALRKQLEKRKIVNKI